MAIYENEIIFNNYKLENSFKNSKASMFFELFYFLSVDCKYCLDLKPANRKFYVIRLPGYQYYLLMYPRVLSLNS